MSKFPWKTMMFWHSMPESSGWEDGYYFFNVSGHPNCNAKILQETMSNALLEAKKKTPLYGKQHTFAAVLTFLSEEKAEVEIIDYVKHEPVEIKKLDSVKGKCKVIVLPEEGNALIRRNIKAFPELCKDFIKDVDKI